MSLFWAFLGVWLVFPFAGLEVTLVAFFGCQVCSATYHQELLSIDDSNIEVAWGKDRPKRRWLFDREGCELEIIRPGHSLSAHQIRLKAGQRSLAIGCKLNKKDIDALIKYFRSTSIPIRFVGETTRQSIDGFDLEQ